MGQGETYFHKFAEEASTPHLIEEEEREITEMIAGLKEKARGSLIVSR